MTMPVISLLLMELPAASGSWQGVAFVAALSLLGLIVKFGERLLDRMPVLGGPPSLTKQIGELMEMLEKGYLTQEEFDTRKKHILKNA